MLGSIDRYRRGLFVMCVTIAFAASTSVAFAAQAEAELSVAVGAGGDPMRDGVGVRLAADYLYNVADLWSVGATAVLTQGDDFAVASAVATARVIVDALTWVPSLSVGAGATSLSGGAWFFRGQAELAYRPARDTSMFVRVCAERAGASGAHTSVAAEVGYRWHFSEAGSLDF